MTDEALTGGTWTPNGRGTLVYRTTPPRPKPRAPRTRTRLADHPCPTCGAGIGEQCHAPSGALTENHVARTPRPCPDCGGPKGVSARYCATCRQERRRATWRANSRRKYARAKEEAA